jgi:pimeloyl-ACP methyl ester carboxylesterase
MNLPHIAHRFTDINGVRVFYRDTEVADGMPMLLLHGFPSSSQQFRRLFDALGSHFRLIAPDYPGFGFSDAPLPVSLGGVFRYSFDHLARVIEQFCIQLSLREFVLYAFDFGGPVALRIASRHPEWIAGLVVQNANAYAEGLSSTAREYIEIGRTGRGQSAPLDALLTLESTREQYLHGATIQERISPDGWTLDQHFLDVPGRKAIQIDLALDYHTNVDAYPSWQDWLRRSQPPLLVLWGRRDPFFLEAGAKAYLSDVPSGELHLFETGHFALEECAPEIVPLLGAFLERVAARRRRSDGRAIRQAEIDAVGSHSNRPALD